MAQVLGLSFYFHDSAAAFVRDGTIVAAAAEERFCRRKHASEFPKRAIEFCIEQGRLDSVNDLDAIIFYEKPVVKLFRIAETMVSSWPRSFEVFVQKLPGYLSSKVGILQTIHKNLPGYTGRVLFSQHHLSHAASAFYCSPFDHAAILTVDGVGEWETTTIGEGRGRDIILRKSIQFPHSLGLLYSALTGYLGFKVNDGEWKVMGLAPYGNPRYVDAFQKLVSMNRDGSFQLNLKYFAHHYSPRWTSNLQAWEKLFGFPKRDPNAEIEQHHEDLARSGQAVVEDLLLNLARAAREMVNSDNLVIAGGVGLNSVANWRIEKEGVFKNIWIQPAAGDDGGALGAALLASQLIFKDPPCSEMCNAYFGPSFSDEDVQSFLNDRQIPYERLDKENLVNKVADLIASDKVVGWFRGAMEFGPRALGARSILANPTKAAMKEIVNRKIKFREYFRPFAPSIPIEHVHEYFDVPPGTALPFMLKVPLVRPEKVSAIPAVTHEDGTGRVQTVRKEDNPVYYNLLKALTPRIGVPVVLNTSFNVRGEPIVCTPEDAYNCFLRTGIDVLVLEDYVITVKPQTEIDPKESYAYSDRLESGEEAPLDEKPSKKISVLAMEGSSTTHQSTTEKVLAFYKELPFNYYSNSLDAAAELSKHNPIEAYRPVHRHLKNLSAARVLDVGCGAGWFVNSCAYYYGHSVFGIEINPVVLKQAISVARLLPGPHKSRFTSINLFDYQPKEPFDVVNSLGVLHHTPDCHSAIKKCLAWVKDDGYIHLGLYHLYGRKPFLEHFERLRRQGASGSELYQEFARLNPDIKDKTHMMSWFRDQVFHPHETQHTYEEIAPILESASFKIEATSIDRFRPHPTLEKIRDLEKRLEDDCRHTLYKKKRYYPGFFTIWAKKELK